MRTLCVALVLALAACTALAATNTTQTSATLFDELRVVVDGDGTPVVSGQLDLASLAFAPASATVKCVTLEIGAETALAVPLFANMTREQFWATPALLFPSTTLAPAETTNFTSTAIGARVGSIYAVKCGVVATDKGDANAVFGRLALPTNAAVISALPSITDNATRACADGLGTLQDPNKWLTDTSFPWATMDTFTGKPGGRDAGDYHGCLFLDDTAFCSVVLKFVSWTGYCVPDSCTTTTFRTALEHSVSSGIVALADPDLRLLQLQTDQAVYADEIARDLNMTADQVEQMLGPVVDGAVGLAVASTSGNLINLLKQKTLQGLSTYSCEDSTGSLATVSLGFFLPLLVLFVVAVTASVFDHVLTSRLLLAELNNNSLAHMAEPPVPSSTNGGEGSNGQHHQHQQQAKRGPQVDWQVGGWLGGLAKAWSLQRNWKQLVEVRPGDLQFFDGIRFFAAAWVILGHTEVFALTFAPLGNPTDVFPSARGGDGKEWWFQLVPGGFFAVDTFLWVGGFFATFIMLRKARKVPTRAFSLSVPLLWANRFLRLLPSLVFVMAAVWVVLPTVGSGPYWSFTTDTNEGCDKNWWREMLFLTAYEPEWGSCLGVTWYLTCDFFYFAVTPFIVLVHLVDKRAGVAVVLALMVATTSYYLYLSHYYGMTSTVLETNEGFNKTYYKPWTRANPYLVGVLLGMLYDHVSPIVKSDPDRRLGWTPCLFLQSAGGAILLMCIFGVYDAVKDMQCSGSDPTCADPGYNWTQETSDFYNVFSRLGFAVGLSLLSVAWIWGKRPCLSSWFLTVPVLAPLGKLSFLAYLWHMFFLTWYYMSQPVPVYYSRLNLLVWWMGFTVAAFFSALASHLLVEAPFSHVQTMAMAQVQRLLFGMPRKARGSSASPLVKGRDDMKKGLLE